MRNRFTPWFCVQQIPKLTKMSEQICSTKWLSAYSVLCWSLGHAEQLLFSGLHSKVTVYDCLSCCHVMLSYVKCLCWSLGHAEQLLFSCLCSKVTVYDCLSCCHVMLSCCHAVICQVLILITGTCWTTFVFMSIRDHLKLPPF